MVQGAVGLFLTVNTRFNVRHGLDQASLSSHPQGRDVLAWPPHQAEASGLAGCWYIGFATCDAAWLAGWYIGFATCAGVAAGLAGRYIGFAASRAAGDAAGAWFTRMVLSRTAGDWTCRASCASCSLTALTKQATAIRVIGSWMTPGFTLSTRLGLSATLQPSGT